MIFPSNSTVTPEDLGLAGGNLKVLHDKVLKEKEKAERTPGKEFIKESRASRLLETISMILPYTPNQGETTVPRSLQSPKGFVPNYTHKDYIGTGGWWQSLGYIDRDNLPSDVIPFFQNSKESGTPVHYSWQDAGTGDIPDKYKLQNATGFDYVLLKKRQRLGE